MLSLNEFPKFAEWCDQKSQLPRQHHSVPETFMLAFADVVDSKEQGQVTLWFNTLINFLAASSDCQNDFLNAEAQLLELGVDFFNVANHLMEHAVRFDCGEKMQKITQDFADQTDLGVFRFLSAWLALNIGNKELCIEECEKVHEPFACIYTLLGQAQLESGQVDSAIETLDIATKLANADIMTWFQIAKAFFVKKNHLKAARALERCLDISPNHPEVIALMAFNLLEDRNNPNRLADAQKILPIILSLIEKGATNSETIVVALELIFITKSREQFKSLVAIAPWKSLRADMNFMKNVAFILRQLEALNWSDENLVLLNKLTESPSNVAVSSGF